MTWRAKARLSCGPWQTTWTYSAPVDSASDATGNAVSDTSGANPAATRVDYERGLRAFESEDPDAFRCITTAGDYLQENAIGWNFL